MNNIVYKDEEIKNLFNKMDLNKDGMISLKEFKHFFTPRNYKVITDKEMFEMKENK